MKNNLVGKTVCWRAIRRYYKVAYVLDDNNIIIEFPKGWRVSKENNELRYENMLSTEKKYWIISDYDVAIKKIINNE